jgi:hypothetical protein
LGSDVERGSKSARLADFDEGAGDPLEVDDHLSTGTVPVVPDSGDGLYGGSDSTGATGTSFPSAHPTFEYISDGTSFNKPRHFANPFLCWLAVPFSCLKQTPSLLFSR